MPVNQSIQQFYKVAATKDFSRDFLFRVTDLKLDGLPALTEDDLIYAKAAQLPARNITNVAVPYMGLPFNVPGNATYPGSENYSLTFFLDQNSELRNYFEVASRILFNDITSTGGYGTPDGDSFIELTQLSKSLDPIAAYKLVGASIRSIDPIEYTMSAGTGQTVDIRVGLAYHYYVKTR